ncbi:MAG: DUF350 domain-containing protein [Arcobacteraceae bacterium]|nr:DUF350 domain-containing protein [Arcobacteraceae bacterium]
MEYGSLLAFGLFFLTGLAFIGVFLYLYALVTPYDDYKMIFQDNNAAAAIGFGGSIIGVSLPLYSALVHSISYVDFLIWGAVAIVVQLIFALLVTRVPSKYNFTKAIEDKKVSVGFMMAFLAICIGIINAGSMSY